ncbi:MAG: PHP domain-containing protein [Spirochaetales bacterium]|nr:PHP domain-containing protein [Spirochaetales bacterium]
MDATALREAINDFSAPSAQRLEALGAYVAAGLLKPGRRQGEVNNHVHTIYSFSPYSPEMTVVKAYEAGLEAVGSVDHDSVAAAQGLAAAGRVAGLAVTSGFEVRVTWPDSQFANKKINFPDSIGRAYIVAHGVPAGSLDAAEKWLAPLRQARILRTRAMNQRMSAILSDAGFGPVDFDTEIVGLSKLSEKGGITERHLLGAAALRILKFIADNSSVRRALSQELKIRLGIAVPPKTAALLDDEKNPHRYYDLLGVLKTTLIEQVWIDPNLNECPTAEAATAFIRSIGGIPAYSYLGDVGESPTGDKKAEAFEDSYLDNFMESVKSLGFQAVTYMPPRNTREQLLRLRKLCQLHGFMEISGVDINSSRQVFSCPEILLPEFRHLNTSTWALIAHEVLSSLNADWGIFSPQSPLAGRPLEERIEAYAAVGAAMDPHFPEKITRPWEAHTTGGKK